MRRGGGGGGRNNNTAAAGRPMKVTNLSSSPHAEQQHHHQHHHHQHHHNNDSPCCRILYDVARQIIPLMPNNSSSSGSGHDEAEDGKSSEIVLPPLLAKMLQEHVFQEREAIVRAAAASSLSANEQGKSLTTSKKKKKKKKKKKSTTLSDQQPSPLEEEEGSEDDGEDETAAAASSTPTRITAATTTTNNNSTVATSNSDKKIKSQQQQQQQDPSPSPGDEILMLKPVSSSTTTTTIEANGSTTTATPKKRMNPWLQDFLTSIRQSMEENEQQKPVATTTTTAIAPPTRKLQDFLDFLSRTSQQPPKNAKSSTSSSSSSSSLAWLHHVTLDQVQEHAIRNVSCPRCQPVMQRYFQHATKVPLLSSLTAIYEKQERLSQNNSSNTYIPATTTTTAGSSSGGRQRPQHYYYSSRAGEPQSLHYQHLHNVNTSSPASLLGLDDDHNDNGNDNNHHYQHHRNYSNSLSSTGRSSSDNDRNAFDYVAMEEGTGQGPSSTSSSSSLQQQQSHGVDESNDGNNKNVTPGLAFVKMLTDQKKSAWQLRRMGHDDSKNNSNNNNGSASLSTSGDFYSSTALTNWTLPDLNFILQEYILVGGLGHDELVMATSSCCGRRLLSDEQFMDIVEGVQVRYSQVLNDLTQCINEILRHEATLKELTSANNGAGGFGDVAAGSGGGNIIDMTGPTTMMDVDTNVCSVLERLLKIILNVTESYQTIGLYLHRSSGTSSSSSGNNGRLPRHVPHLLTNDWVIMSMWQVYLKAFGDILASTLAFEQKLFSIADRHGKINPFFCNGTARQFLYELVKNKVRIVVLAVDNIKCLLDDRLDVVETAIGTYRPTCMRSMFTYEAFLSMIGETNKKAAKSPLDLACADVLFEMREWSETVQESSIANILDKHRARRDRLFRLLHITQKRFQTDIEAVKGSSPNDTQQYNDQVWQSMGQPLTALLKKYSSSDSSSDDQADLNSQEALAALRGQLPYTILSSIQLWLSLSINPGGQNEREENASPIAAMPLRLVQFLIARAKDEFDPSRCLGPDGTVRAALSMTALFCRWLSDRFNEWHAELVQQELLTSMDDEQQQPAQTSASSLATNGKSAKKAKKKKAKTSLAVTSSSTVSDEVSSKDQPIAGAAGNGTNGSKPDLASAGKAIADVQDGPREVVGPANGNEAAALPAVLDEQEKQETGVCPSITPLDPETTDVLHASLPPQQPDVDVSHLESKTPITALTDGSDFGNNTGGIDVAKIQTNGKSASGQEGHGYSDTSDAALLDVDPFVQIGVHDRAAFISAESFLVGRLLQVITGRDDEGQRNVTVL